MREILAQAEAICRAAGTSLQNAVRIQQFHPDLADLPGARLQVDLWVSIPD
jgi:enamine deaminase RidA (YjgF/YER057c/UK114 family)